MNILSINLLSGRTWCGKIASAISDAAWKNWHITRSIVGYSTELCSNGRSLFKDKPLGFMYYLWVALNFFFEVFRPGKLNYHKLSKLPEYRSADIIHMHAIQWGYFNWHDLPKISKEKKIIWTLHDDWLTAWSDSLYFPYKNGISYERRKKILIDSQIHVVGVSDWITNKALLSGMFPSERIHRIYNWIDLSIFYPRDWINLRKKYGIPEKCEVIISLAWAGRKSNSKGLAYVKKIISQYAQDKSKYFITVGNSEEKQISGNFRELGFVSHDTMADYFSLSSFFLYPTLADSFGLVIAESLACWCPVLTYEIAAVPELVHHEINGYVAKYKDQEDLENGFKWMIENSRFMERKQDSRFSDEQMFSQYMDLYDNIT